MSRYVSPHWPLMVVVLLAVAVRVYWVRHDEHIAEGDECEYLRLAQNVVDSHRYVGLFDGPQVMYPPLYPLVIAAVSFASGSYVAAGEVCSFVAGVFLVVLIFLLARYLYGAKVGLIAATLAACHPALIELSDAVYSESLYMPLVVCGVFFGIRHLEDRGRSAALACGASFGLAYLTRPEAIVYPFVIVLAALLSARAARVPAGGALVRALPILAAAGVVALPYVAYLSLQTGTLRIEGKSVMNYTIGERIDAGMSREEATLGIDGALREQGPFLSPNRWVLSAPSAVPFGTLLRYWVRTAHRNREALEDDLLYLVFGPTGVSFLALGLFGQSWNRRRLFREGVILTVVLGYAFVLLGQHYVSFRYAVPLLPFMLVWGSRGVDQARHWHGATARNATRHAPRVVRRFALGSGYVTAVALLLLAFHRLTWAGDFHSHRAGEDSLREAGEWISRHRPGAKTVMSVSNEVPYYAGGTALRFPFAEADRALDYIRRKSPDFLVLTRQPSQVGAYYRDWFDHGVPDPAARLACRIGRDDESQVLIYEWTAAR